MAESRNGKGLKKRDRTRLQLVEAAIRLFGNKGVGGTSVQSVALEAGLANGTFYNHFTTKHDLVVAVAAHLMDRLADQIAASCRGLDDPAEWVSVALRRFNERAREDPNWGNVTVRLGSSASEVSERISANMTRDIEKGVRRGRFIVPSRQAAADAVLGAGLIGLLSVSNGRAGPEHGSNIATVTLRALGIDADEAAEIARRPLPPLPED